MKKAKNSNNNLIIRIILNALIDVVLISSSIFSFFIFRDLLLFIAFIVTAISILLIVYFLFFLVINYYKARVIEIEVDDKNLIIKRNNGIETYSFNTLYQYKKYYKDSNLIGFKLYFNDGKVNLNRIDSELINKIDTIIEGDNEN